MSAVVDTHGNYQRLFDVYWPIGVGVGVVIWILILFMAIRYRRRRDDVAPPSRVAEKSVPEGVYVGTLALVCAFLVILTFHTMGKDVADLPAEAASHGQEDTSPAKTPRPALRVQVVGARWDWRFDYPGKGITQQGDLYHVPTLVVPVGNVQFSGTSLDVIHSFFIPDMRFKRDVFPNRTTRWTLGFPKPAYYKDEGECAEFCGLRHSYMWFNVRVLSPTAFRRWVTARQHGTPQETTPNLNRKGTFSS